MAEAAPVAEAQSEEAPQAEPEVAEATPRRPSRRSSRRRGAKPRSEGRGSEGRDGRGTRSGRRRVKDLVEFLVQELVDEPDAVSIEESFDDRGPRYRVRWRRRTWAR